MSKFAIIFPVLATCLACQKTGAKSSETTQPAANPLSDSAWLQDCKTEDSNSHIFVLAFSEKYFFASLKVFSDEACQDSYFTESISGTYVTGGDVEKPRGAKAIDIDYQAVYMTPDTDDAAAELNSQQRCDKSDWQAGEEVNLTEFGCSLKGVQMGMNYSIFAIEGDKYFDAASDDKKTGLTPTTRPTSLDYDNPFIRQPK